LVSEKGIESMKNSYPVIMVIALASILLFSGCTTTTQAPSTTSSTSAAPVSSTATTPATIELKYALPIPPTHVFGKAAEAWIAKIQNDTNGRVQITPFWGGSLIARPNCVDETVKGVADISHIEPGATRTGFDIYKGSFGFYHGINDIATELRIYKEVNDEFPAYEAETSDILKIVGRIPGMIYQLMSNKPIRTIDDFRGLKIRGPATLVNIFKEVGGEGINIPMSEVYTALQKGTIDAALSCDEALKSWNLAEVVKYVTIIDLTSPTTNSIVINLDVWNSLPPDIQKVFEDNIEWYETELIRTIEGDDQAGYEFGKQLGVEFIELEPAVLEEFNEIVASTMLEEAAKLDDQGYPGTDIYEEIRKLAAKYGE
jgi:TRAP-type C4-dicarboxylate transport system substrate-binding protein